VLLHTVMPRGLNSFVMSYNWLWFQLECAVLPNFATRLHIVVVVVFIFYVVASGVLCASDCNFAVSYLLRVHQVSVWWHIVCLCVLPMAV